LAACCLAACVVLGAEAADDDGKIPMRIWGLPSARATGVQAKPGQTMLKGFLERYPQYAPEPFHMLAIREGGMDEGPLMAIATGVEPHGIYVNFRQSSTYINQAHYHGDVDALNRAHGTGYAALAAVRMPIAETEARYVQRHSGMLRRRYALRNYRIVAL
jgi:hypothetical protein